MRLGVHCSVRKGMMHALDEARALGCETLQIFTHAPRLWRAPRITPEEADQFHRRRQELGLYPLVVHTPFLPNLCSTKETIYARSYHALLSDLEICERIRADYFIIHPGSYSEGSTVGEAIQRMAEALNRAMALGGKSILVIENMAGGSRRIGDLFEQLRDLRNQITVPERLAFCLDTAHTLGSGYAFSTPHEVKETLDLFDHTVGLQHLRVIHANDSRAPRGSHRDLHEHIGRGLIGREAFGALLQDPRIAHAAVILETPKYGEATDKENLDLLRALREP